MLVFPGSREGRSSSVLVPGLLGLTLCRALAEESHLSALELDEGRELFFFFFFFLTGKKPLSVFVILH